MSREYESHSKTQDNFKRYTLRTPTHESATRNTQSLYPDVTNVSYNASSPSPTSKYTVRDSYMNGYRRLHNKQWIDSLYEEGKRKLQARSKSAYMTMKEAEDLKKCTFQPRIKHTQRNENSYHRNKSTHIHSLSQKPVREKAHLERIKRELKGLKECTFTPKLMTSKSTRDNRSKSVFDSLYQENKKRQKSRRRNEVANKNKDLEGVTFKPKINSERKLRAPFSKPRPDVQTRMMEDLVKRKERYHSRKHLKAKTDRENNTFTPHLVAKRVPRHYDSDDSDTPFVGIHQRLYKKHASMVRKKDKMKKEYESEILKNAPNTGGDHYLSKLKNLYSNSVLPNNPFKENENSLNMNVTINRNEEGKGKSANDANLYKMKEELQQYLDNTNVHDRLFQQSLTIEDKKKMICKRSEQERGIIFQPKITAYPIRAHKRQPLYKSAWRPAK